MELAERWPEHVVCAWIGNSKAVAREHYLQVTGVHLEQASAIPERKDQVAQNPTQQAHAEVRIESFGVNEPAKYDVKRGSARCCETAMGRVGFEPT